VDVSAARVDAVISTVERHDASLANWMQVAADGLTAGEGEELITQAGLQRYLWYDLPRRRADDTWRPVAEAAAVLLSLLGLVRYAAIARSLTTTAVLGAWEEAPGKGFAAFRAASNASGVEPPDTELLAWGEVFGMEEAWTLQAVEVALEGAIVAGELQPGKGPWRKVAARICDEVLLAPAGEGGATRLQAILGERAETWVAQGRPADLRAWRDAARARTDLLEPVVVEASEAAGATAPMRWLLKRCREGVQLTQAGYLPPAVAQEAADRFGWWEFPGRPRSEVDVHQLGVHRDTATRLHLVGRRSRRLATTRRGVLLAEDPAALFGEIATTLACEDDYLAMLSELVAHRLLAGLAIDHALEQAVGPIIVAQGWTAGREPLTAEQAGWSVHRALYHWRLFGLLDETRPRWEGGRQTEPTVTALTPAGRTAASAFLRARATAPGRRSTVGLG
jgi:hypothetical protein